jgi:hypothetical protein
MKGRAIPVVVMFLTSLGAAPASAADLALMAELPTASTPMLRYDWGRDEVLPLGLGLRASYETAWRERTDVFFGPSLRGRRSAIDTPLLQLRLDFGLRHFLAWGERASPYLELATGTEHIWHLAPDGTTRDVLIGPSLGMGARFGEHDRPNIVGARLTTAFSFFRTSFDHHVVDNADGDYAYGYRPSNLALAIYAGRVF